MTTILVVGSINLFLTFLLLVLVVQSFDIMVIYGVVYGFIDEYVCV